MILFVYGTLQRGCTAHEMLALRDASFLGKALLDGFALYNLGPYPGIIPDTKESVLGEAYRIDQFTLDALDQYEGEGTLYNRYLTDIRLQNGDMMKAFAYVYNYPVQSGNKIPMERQPWRKGA